jgi:hypothetical protein
MNFDVWIYGGVFELGITNDHVLRTTGLLVFDHGYFDVWNHGGVLVFRITNDHLSRITGLLVFDHGYFNVWIYWGVFELGITNDQWSRVSLCWTPGMFMFGFTGVYLCLGITNDHWSGVKDRGWACVGSRYFYIWNHGCVLVLEITVYLVHKLILGMNKLGIIMNWKSCVWRGPKLTKL